MRKKHYPLKELLQRDNDHKKALQTHFYKLREAVEGVLKKHPELKEELHIPLNRTLEAVNGLAYGKYYGTISQAPEGELMVECEEEEPS